MESTNTTAPSASLQCVVPSKKKNNKKKNKNKNNEKDEENPNYNIPDYIIIYDISTSGGNSKNIIKNDVKNVLFFDASMSQGPSVSYFKMLLNNTIRTLFSLNMPFGSSERSVDHANPYNRFMNWDEFVEAISSKPGFFQHSTFVNKIEAGLQLLNPQELYNLVFQCDGSFSDSFPVMLQRNIQYLQNVKSISVVYSPHTSPFVRKNLDDEIKKIMELAPSYIQFTSILMDKNDMDVFNNLVPTLPQTGVVVPKDYLNWGSILFHTDLTAINIANYLLNNLPEVLPQIIDDLRKTIQTNPRVFECSDNIYILLYSIISCLNNTTKNDDENIFKDFIDWISTFKKDADKNTQELLTRLIRDSRQRPADIKWKQEQLFCVAIGSIKFNPLYSPQDLLQKIADGSCIQLCNEIKNALKHLNFTPKTKGNKLDIESWLVPNPQKCSRQDAIIFFGLFFSQFGNFKVEGIKIYIIALQILTTDAEINNVILNLAKKIVLGEESYDYNMKMIGYSVQQNTGNFSIDNPLWFSYEMSMLLYQTISQFGNEMFDTQENINTLSIINLFKKLIRIHKTIYSIKNNHPRIKRDIRVPIVQNTTEINPIIIGGIYVVSPDSWKEIPDPERRLPSMVIVLKKRKNGNFSCEYLDNVSKRNIDGKFLIYFCSSEYKEQIYHYLSSIKGKILPNEEGLAEQEILKTRFNHIHNNIITDNDKSSSNYTGDEIQYKIVEQQITIPMELVCEIVGITNPEYIQLILKLSVLNRNELLTCVGLIENNPMTSPQHYQFKVNDGKIYQLSQEELNSINQQFQEKLVVRLTTSTGSRHKDCIICLCPCSAWKMNPLDCSHYICPDCSPNMTPDYNPGDFIEPFRHNCPICRIPITPKKFKEFCCVSLPWFNSWDKFMGNETFDFTQFIYRFCRDCGDVFEAGNNTCEDHRDTFPEQCEECRTPLFFNCPNCEIQLQHAGGCSIIRCCIHGYHGCPDEEFYDYETNSYEYPDDYPEELKCNHGGCCGCVFDINPEQKSFGN